MQLVKKRAGKVPPPPINVKAGREQKARVDDSRQRFAALRRRRGV